MNDEYFKESRDQIAQNHKCTVAAYEEAESECMGDDEPLLRLARFHDVMLKQDEKSTRATKRKQVIDDRFYQGITGVSVAMLYDLSALSNDVTLYETEGWCRPQKWWESLNPKTTEQRSDTDPGGLSLEKPEDIPDFIAEQGSAERNLFRMLVIETVQEIAKEYREKIVKSLKFRKELVKLLRLDGMPEYSRLENKLFQRLNNKDSKIADKYNKFKKVDAAIKVKKLTKDISFIKKFLKENL